MDNQEKTDLMVCIIVNFMHHNGSLMDELTEAIQDCGFSDREIMDITRAAVNISNEQRKNGKT